MNTLCNGKFTLITTYATSVLVDLGIEKEVNAIWGNDETPLMEIAVEKSYLRDYLMELLAEAAGNGNAPILDSADETIGDADIEKFLGEATYDDLEGIAGMAFQNDRFAFTRLIAAKLPDGADDLYLYPDYVDPDEGDIATCRMQALEEYLRSETPFQRYCRAIRGRKDGPVRVESGALRFGDPDMAEYFAMFMRMAGCSAFRRLNLVRETDA